MFAPDRVYAFDIETDTSGGGGLDPRRARITEIAVKTAESLGGGEVFALEEDSDEAEIALLASTDDFLRQLPPGLLSTWNGSFFDGSFIETRRSLAAPFLGLGLRLQFDPNLVPKYPPPDGLPVGGYSLIWETRPGQLPHQHLDISRAYKKFAEEHGIPWRLKPVCQAHGIDMIELDRENMHLYTPQQRKDYCLSDGHGTRELTLLLLGLA